MDTAQSKLEGINNGEEPSLAKDFLELDSTPIPDVQQQIKYLSIFLGILNDAILETIDSNNKAIEKYILSTH